MVLWSDGLGAWVGGETRLNHRVAEARSFMRGSVLEIADGDSLKVGWSVGVWVGYGMFGCRGFLF